MSFFTQGVNRIRCLAIGSALASITATTAVYAQRAQQAIPVRPLAPASGASGEILGRIGGLRQLSNGDVLVSDADGKRLLVFDSALKNFTVTADSIRAGSNRYPRTYFGSLYRYLGDSTLISDMESQTLLVIGPTGKIVRAMAPPNPKDIRDFDLNLNSAAAVDAYGRLIYQVRKPGGRLPLPPPPGSSPAPPATRDTGLIVRANFETRAIDTIGMVTHPRSARAITVDSGGKTSSLMRITPVLAAPDVWAVLSNGSLAIVRGDDYHIDWVYAGGTRASTAKMRFDWRRLTDEDKRAKVDSVRRIIDSVSASGYSYGRSILQTRTEGGVRTDTIVPRIEFVPLAEIPDYVPSIRDGAAKPDADGNLWILPTTSSQAVGGLLYDVVNQNGEIFERVRLPAGRDIAGFGKGGVIYLMWRDGTGGYRLERTRIVR